MRDWLRRSRCLSLFRRKGMLSVLPISYLNSQISDLEMR